MDSPDDRSTGFTRRGMLAFALATAAPRLSFAAEPPMGDDGLYQQDWFLQSFLDLAEDLAEATAKSKRFVLLWEQHGCPYCHDLHRINFADARAVAYIRERFAVLQLNLWGDREVTDFDGEKLREKDFARKYRINISSKNRRRGGKERRRKISPLKLELSNLIMIPIEFHYGYGVFFSCRAAI